MEKREPRWYTESAKKTGRERGSPYGQDNTGSATSSTDNEVSRKAWGDGDTVQDEPKDGNEVVEAVGRNGGESA
jgi:hypothetical protein